MSKAYAVMLEDLIVGIFDTQEDATVCVQAHVADDDAHAILVPEDDVLPPPPHDANGDGDAPPDVDDEDDEWDPFDVYDGVGDLGRYRIIELERNRDYFPVMQIDEPPRST
jgi:hypothetical protein